MSSESRTEETKPVASGLDLRLRLLHRLADSDRNAAWAQLILAGVMLVGSAFTLYIALTRWEWQLFSLAGIYGGVMVVSLSGFWLAKRGRPSASTWIVLITLQLAIAISPLFVSGLGLWYAIGILVATLSITSLCMRPQRTAVANLLGIAASLTALVIDGFLNQLQITPGQIIKNFVITEVVILAVIYLLILIGYFPTYTLRAKITITVFSAAILSIGALSIVNSISTQRALINAVNQTLTLAARETGRDVDGYFRELAERVANQADTPTWSIYLALPPAQQAANSTTQPFLVTQKLLTGALYYTLLDREGNVILHTTEEDTVMLEPYLGLSGGVRGSLLQTMSSGAVYISPVIFPPTGEVPNFLVAAQIRNYADEPVGILVAAFPLDTVQEFISAGNDTAGTGSYAVLLDENHLRIAHGTDPSAQYRLLVPPTPRVYEELVSSLRLPSVGFDEVATNYPDFNDGLSNLGESAYFSSEDSATPGEENSVAAIRLGSRPWVLVFLQPQSVILAPVAAQTRSNILLAVIVSGLTILAAALLARLVADPIVRLTSIAERAAGGNLYLQASTQSQDEIGTLGTAFNSMINQLRNTLEGLEARIAERTAELTQTSEQMEYRANRLQMVTEVAHAIAAVQDPEELLPRVTTEISTRYSYYHVGVFLVDSEKMYAVLHASNSEGGQRMLARHHRLRIGEVGIVGFVAGTGEARIALDVGKDAVFFDNPDLPETRSEIALPLKVGPEVIGVLDVQSTEPGAFSQDDIALLSALADQVATAIQNTRLYDEMRRTLRELQVVQQQYVQDAWSKLISERASSGFEYSFGRIKPIKESDSGAEVQGIENLAAPRVSSDGSGKLIVPVSLRGQVIGVLDLHEADPGREWRQEDLELARAVADQVGLALENARLLAETQRRAERERLVADITTKMRAINDPQAILETAAAELRNALRVKSVQVHLQTVEVSPSETLQSESDARDVHLEQGGEK
jgi:GAF domain-containing protein/HAMP domain-containing protein